MLHFVLARLLQGFELSTPNDALVNMAGSAELTNAKATPLERSKTSKHIPPPEAGGAWPVIGHLHLLGTTSDRLPHVTLGDMADEYGPIFTIRVGLKRAVVVSDWEVAKECFTTHDLVVLSRPKFLAAHLLGYNYAMFGFSPYGAYWRDIRKISSLELLGSRRLELLKHVRVSETEASIKELHKLCTEAKTNSGCVMVEMKRWFSDLAMNVVVRMVAGKRYFGVATDGDEKEGRRCQKALRDIFYFLGLFLVADAIPFLRWLDLGGHEKAMKETFKEADNLLSRWLDEHRRRKESAESCKGDQDFMDVMLSTLEGADLAGYDADTINKATCLMLHLVLARLLHEFELSTPDDALVDMTESAGLTNAKATPLQVLITPRLAPTLQ
ncbi:hypothetical protein RHSIM_Rhsim06G0040500 [Rhododendron simsii]|uniref:Cytochrome P450 n=1 Tax=Rhododendron simsii TaxID=118357 RepID=A0A834LN86_RHOSS|nr:hypothetical protein RHSIM_Rhsim06G0040500 [Rhododendron simsii]